MVDPIPLTRRRMRSAAAGLSAAGALAMLGGCDGADEAQASRERFGAPTEVSAFQTISECVATGRFTEEQCNTADLEARKANAQQAPRFADQQTCEEQFGANQCQYQPAVGNTGGQSFFTPLLTGFMIGQLLNGGGSRYHYAPLYRSRHDDRYYTGSGGWLYGGGGSGRYQVGSRAIQPVTTQRIQTRSSVVSRGGFGGRASARSSGGWGGGRSFGG